MTLNETKGLCATVVTRGYVDETFAEYLSHMRSWTDRNDFHKIEWRSFGAPFVSAGRDAIMAHALAQDYDWVLQIDADAAPFPDTLLVTLLQNAYVDVPHADVVGAYAQLKHAPYLPVIDTGTGTWEPHFPGAGLLEVIRTGGHCFLTKTPVLRRMGQSWFRPRTTIAPARAMAEVDNFARMRLDGRNPLTSVPEWETLFAEASKVGAGEPSGVGEDSSFCDAVKAAGGRIFVNTDLVVGHVGKQVIGPKMLLDAMKALELEIRQACGVME